MCLIPVVVALYVGAPISKTGATPTPAWNAFLLFGGPSKFTSKTGTYLDADIWQEWHFPGSVCGYSISLNCKFCKSHLSRIHEKIDSHRSNIFYRYANIVWRSNFQ
jgi:hypothetical protein